MAISHCTFYAASRWGKKKKKETENVHCGRLRNGAFCCFWPSSRLSFLYMFQSRFGIILQICIYISLAYIKSIFHPTSWSVGRPSKLHHVSVCECWWFILFGHMCVFHYGHLYWCRIGVCVVECAGVCVCVCVSGWLCECGKVQAAVARRARRIQKFRLLQGTECVMKNVWGMTGKRAMQRDNCHGVGMWGISGDVRRCRSSSRWSTRWRSYRLDKREADVGPRRLNANRAHDKQNASHTLTHTARNL